MLLLSVMTYSLNIVENPLEVLAGAFLKANNRFLPRCQTVPLINRYEPHKHLHCIHISLDMALLVAAVVLVRETSRLQLFHLHLPVRQRCQFVLINLLLGSSLVSNVEAAAAHFCSGGGGRGHPQSGSLLPVSKGKQCSILVP